MARARFNPLPSKKLSSDDMEKILARGVTVPTPHGPVSLRRFALLQAPITKDSLKTLAETRPTKVDFKPKPALWYACGAEWLEFLVTNLPERLRPGMHLYAIGVKSTLLRDPIEPHPRRVLRISNTREFDRFERVYGSFAPWQSFGDDKYIDWNRVSKDFGGIEICPYLWERRLSTGWYYPWDVASGAIWSPGVFSDIYQIARTVSGPEGVLWEIA